MSNEEPQAPPYATRSLLAPDLGQAGPLPQDLDETLRAWATGERFSGSPQKIGTFRVIAKGGRIGKSGRRRHTIRRWLAGAITPRESEYRNLLWLRERLFNAPMPLVAMSAWRRGVLQGELLVTRAVEGAQPLDEAWGSDSHKEQLAQELGTELGRLHALRFLHGDPYPRNLLVTPTAANDGPGVGRRVVMIDCWAGGPGPRLGTLQPLERDLGCLMLEAPSWMDREHQALIFQAYLEARAANGNPVRDRSRWMRRVRQARLRELRRVTRRPSRLRGRDLPQADWQPPL